MYRCIFAMGFISLLAASAFGQVQVFVDVNTPAAQVDQIGNYWDSAFDTIQEGIDLAITHGPGTEVIVAYGEYTEARNRTPRGHADNCGALVISNGVILKGGYDPVTGVRDAQERWTTIDGSTALNGGHALHTVMIDGDGTIENCRIVGGVSSGTNDATGYGAGLLAYYGHATVTNCFFYENSANHSGGAMAAVQATLEINDCDFNMNFARENGGGLFMMDSVVTIAQNSTFYQNEAGLLGGAIAKVAGDLSVMRANFVENSAQDGGGLHLANGDFEFLYCTFNGNAANGSGGGAVISDCTGEFTNSLFSANTAGSRGAGLTTINANAKVMNCTFSANTGAAFPDGAGGIFARTAGTVEITNSILWGDSAPEWASIDDAVVIQTYSDVQGGLTGNGNINQNPMFATSGSYFLKIDGPEVSPCVDSGTATNAPTSSLMNILRPTGSGVDMGAYEMSTTQETVSLLVSVTGNGWTSPAPGYHRFYRGATVELTCTPTDGANFLRWEGGSTATTINTSITLTADASEVTAVFEGGQPAEGAPAEGAPAEGTPAEGAPAEGAPADGAPAEGTPAEGVPAEGAPAEGAPAEGAPAEGAPAEGTPAEGAPAEGAPAEGAPAEGAPADGAPADGTPAEGTPAEGTPAEGTPAEGQQDTSSRGCFGGMTTQGPSSGSGSGFLLLVTCGALLFAGKRPRKALVSE